MGRTIKKESLTEQAYDLLKKDILNFRIEQGEKLVIDQICKEFELSNTPVREAIRRLQQEGFVVQRENAGFFVKKIGSDELENFSNIIKMIEIAAVQELIIDGKIKDTIPALKKHLEFQKSLLDDTKSLEFEKEAMDFDRVFIKALKNSELSRIIDSVMEIFVFSVHEFLNKEENKLKSISDHGRIIESIENEEYGELIEILREHYKIGMSTFLHEIE